MSNSSKRKGGECVNSLGNVQAGFHQELLPTWGGKAENILKQPKCWSSKSVTQNLRKGESLVNPRLYKRNDQRERIKLQHMKSILKNQSDTEIVGGTTPEHHESEDLDSSSRISSKTQAIARVVEKCNEIRSNPNAFTDLIKRIQQRKRQNVSTSIVGERNLIIENKWLCDDKEQCLSYWEEINDLKERIRNASCVEEKLVYYSAWPHPPKENHSKEERLEKIKARALEKELRLNEVTQRRESLEGKRLLRLNYIINKKEVMIEETRRMERAGQIFEVLRKITYLTSSGEIFGTRLKQVREKHQEYREQTRCAKLIQRKWKKSKANEDGLQFRNAIKVIRKFVRAAANSRRQKKFKKSGEIIHWFLVLYEHSNFQNVMRNYRLKVVNCQRYWRMYVEVTKVRLKVLGMKWDKVEREKIRVEKQKALRGFKKLEKEVGGGGFTRGFANPNLLYLKNQRALKKENAMLVGKTHHQKLSKTNFRKNSTQQRHNSFMRKASAMDGMISNAHAMATSAEVGVHVRKRVPKTLKKKLLLNYLQTQRIKFKSKWREYCRTRNILKAQSRLLTVEDVRAVVRSQTNVELKEMLDKKTDNKEYAKYAPAMFIYSITSDQVINEMIEQARNMVDEHMLDCLNHEMTGLGRQKTNIFLKDSSTVHLPIREK